LSYWKPEKRAIQTKHKLLSAPKTIIGSGRGKRGPNVGLFFQKKKKKPKGGPCRQKNRSLVVPAQGTRKEKEE